MYPDEADLSAISLKRHAKILIQEVITKIKKLQFHIQAFFKF
jgi:hypothetical protein